MVTRVQAGETLQICSFLVKPKKRPAGGRTAWFVSWRRESASKAAGVVDSGTRSEALYVGVALPSWFGSCGAQAPENWSSPEMTRF